MTDTLAPEIPVGRGFVAAFVAVVLLAIAAPIVFFNRTWDNAPLVTPQQARLLVTDPNVGAVLVDIRTADEYRQAHLDLTRSENWPLSDILTRGPGAMPESLRGRRLVLLCNSGYGSAKAARYLQRNGVANVFSVRGGMQEWIVRSGGSPNEPFHGVRLADGATQPLPAREMTRGEQFLAVFAGFVVKTLYGLLAFVLVVVLWRSRAADLAALRWAMIAFFIGENACAANYVFFNEQSFLMEYIHSVGMLFSFGSATYALLEGFDRRILSLSDPAKRCAALPLCGQCIKLAAVPCGLRRVFVVMLPALLVVSLMPLTANFVLDAYSSNVFGSHYAYLSRVAYQTFETRYCPWLASGFFAASLVVLLAWPRRLPAAKILLAAGAGPMGFGLLRMILNQSYRENMVYSVVWEESTEFLFVAGVCAVLWVFRKTLFRPSAASPDPAT